MGILEKVIGRQGLVYLTHLKGTNRDIFDVLGLSSVTMLFDTDEAAREHNAPRQGPRRPPQGNGAVDTVPRQFYEQFDDATKLKVRDFS